MTRFFEPLYAAWISISAHKLRSFLTILGVVIGVAAVITLMSIGKGTESNILSRLSGLGTNLLFVQPGSTTQGGVRTGVGSATTLTLEDAEAIAGEVSNVYAVAPSISSGLQVRTSTQNMFVRVTGVTPDYQQVYNLQVTSGDFISQYYYERALKVAILGPNVVSTLFPDGSDPVGQQIRLGNSVVQIIGVLQSKGASMMGSTDDTILIPLTTLQAMTARSMTTSGEHIVNQISLLVADQNFIKDVTAEITALLQTRHKIALGSDNDFTVTSMEDLTNTITQAVGSMTLLLGAIAAISLLVGGIGVMNIMLVSVVERRREIGVRKALGATERSIWGQFLLDAAILTLTGGIIGVAAGWGVSILVSNFASLPTLVSADIVMLAVGVSVAIGLFFGFYPALQASRLNPIEALRAE